jgi:hypothetical protein
VRTTITLDADTAALVDKRMREQGVSFKQAVNDAIRAGLAPPARRRPFRTPSRKLGLPAVSLDRALALAGALEDEELTRKLQLGK